MKKCKYCAEEIQEEARLCKHCGKSLRTVSPLRILAWVLGGLFAVSILGSLLSQRQESSRPSAGDSLTGQQATRTPSANTVAQPSGKDFEILAIDSRVTDSNDVWWKYAWKLTLRNNSDETHSFQAVIEFQDKDGFVVDDDRADDLVVSPKSEKVFTGYALIDSDVAGKVATTDAKVQMRE